MTSMPRGFRSNTANLGIRDGSLDFMCVLAEVPCAATGVFTQNLFVGPSVTVSREHVRDGRARAVVTISKNANVANGDQGRADAREVVRLIAHELGIDPGDVLIASTGVIGRPYPMEKIRAGVAGLGARMAPADFDLAARAMMTTDTRPKLASRSVGGAALVGVAKGVGMCEPNMATVLTYYFTDAAVDVAALRPMFKRVMDRTFNSISVDSDTSTSDSAVILANGLAGTVPLADFERALFEVASELAYAVVSDGEGATKVIKVTVEGGRDEVQSKRVAKSIVNSPLVKTAVHGADPNWGRVAMAIGKCEDQRDIDVDRVVIRFGELEVYPRRLDPSELARLRETMAQQEVQISVDLRAGNATATVWGCDLSKEYVEINGSYST